MIFHENTGTKSDPVFLEGSGVVNPFNLLNGSSASHSIEFIDIDSDNDLDAFLVLQNGKLAAQINNGTNESPEFAELLVDPFGLDTKVIFSHKPSFLDFEGDGDIDIVINGIAPDDPISGYHVFENTGTTSEAEFNDSARSIDHKSVLDADANDGIITTNNSSGQSTIVADLDNDGDIDYLTGYSSGVLVLDENIGTQIYDIVPRKFIDRSYESGIFQLHIRDNKWSLNVIREYIGETTQNNHSLEFSIDADDGTAQTLTFENVQLNFPELPTDDLFKVKPDFTEALNGLIIHHNPFL